jgi:hypothetical protein
MNVRFKTTLLVTLLSVSPAMAELTPRVEPDRPVRFHGEVGVLSMLPLLGDPSLQLGVGVEVSALRLTVLARMNTPGRMSTLSASSLFVGGERFDVFWGGESSLVVRFRPVASLGLDVNAGVGFERFSLRSSDGAGEVTNGFAGLGVGYAFTFFDRIFLRLGGAATFLFGGPPRIQVGSQETRLSWGFVSPEVQFGLRL